MNPDGSEDDELKIRDLPGIKVGDYTLQLPPTSRKVQIIDTLPALEPEPEPLAPQASQTTDPPPFEMNLRKRNLQSATYHMRDEEEGGCVDSEEEEDQADVTTDSGDETDRRFDSDDEEDFNPNFDEIDVMDMNMSRG